MINLKLNTYINKCSTEYEVFFNINTAKFVLTQFLSITQHPENIIRETGTVIKFPPPTYLERTASEPHHSNLRLIYSRKQFRRKPNNNYHTKTNKRKNHQGSQGLITKENMALWSGVIMCRLFSSLHARVAGSTMALVRRLSPVKQGLRACVLFIVTPQ